MIPVNWYNTITARETARAEPTERQEERTMRNTLRMWYYLPGQSELYSAPQMFETSNGNEWERAVNIAHEKGYKIVKVEIVK